METKNVFTTTVSEDVNKHEVWFTDFIKQITDKIKSDKKSLELGEASPETISLYSNLSSGNPLGFASDARNSVSNAIIQEIIVSYFNLIGEKKIAFTKLALDISTNKVLVWAEIEDNDEKSEMAIIRVESIINSIYSKKTGIDLDSIIVEKSDNLTVPSHYQEIELS
jgi:hypothetical protein